MLTSRAEHRLLLRQDNADLRLAPIGYDVGLIGDEQYQKVEEKRAGVTREMERLGKTYLPQDGSIDPHLVSIGLTPVRKAVTGLEFLRRPEVGYQTAVELGLGDEGLGEEEREQVEIEAKYQDYIERQGREVERIRRLEQRPIPAGRGLQGDQGPFQRGPGQPGPFRTADGRTGCPGPGGEDFGYQPAAGAPGAEPGEG